MKLVAWLLLIAGMGVLVLGDPSSGAGEGEINRSDPEYLRKQYAFFQSLRPSRQEQLRKLDADFHNLDRETQERLSKVLDRYNWWLSQLSPEDRRRVTAAETPSERLKIVREIRNREWIESLPEAYRMEYEDALAKSGRGRAMELIDKWRDEQRKRRDDWLRETWLEGQSAEQAKPKIPEWLQSDEVIRALNEYLKNLKTQIPASQRDRLEIYQDQKLQDIEWLRYLRLVVDLADRYPLIPGPQDGPRSYDALPKGVKDSLERADRNFTKKKSLPQDLQKSLGRWPDFAVAVSNYAKANRIPLSEPIAPATRAEMPPEVQAFVDKLETVLRRQEKSERANQAAAASRDLARLKDAEGKWPDYPRTIVDLAKQHRLPIPGWTLPGRNDAWDAFRIKFPRRN